ncbi:MAG: thioesterase family protein [Candidatus Thermoplasmatota archaeon]|nr:thioesterase family protein [Candidatus Thermoplasmatota archaeon]
METPDSERGWIVTHISVIYPWQMDHMGHMNVQFYASLFDQATWSFFSEYGITRNYLMDNERGMAALVQHTEYKHELFAGSVVEIRSRLDSATPKIINFTHRMYLRQAQILVATTEFTGVHVDRSKRKSVPFPDDILQRLKSSIPE